MNVTHAMDHQHPHPADPAFDSAATGVDQAAPTYSQGFDLRALDGPPDRTQGYLPPAPNRFAQFVVRMNERAPRWAGPAAIAVCFAGAASYVWIANPTDTSAADVSTCIIKLTTGLDCPGCGGTRAFYYLMHGNIPEAARHHAMAVFAAPFLVWLYVAWALNFIWGRKIPVPTISSKTISFFLAAWMVFMVARNLPFAPFTSLYV